MGKHEIKQKETQVATEQGVGKQLERVYTVDDNCLPSPQELIAYKEIDPRIVDYLINASIKEQEHRHKMDEGKLKIVAKSDGRIGRINWWGMFFAFLFLIAFIALSGYALYLDKPWFATFFGGFAIATIVKVFVLKSDDDENKKTKK